MALACEFFIVIVIIIIVTMMMMIIIIVVIIFIMIRQQFWRSLKTCTCAELPLLTRAGFSQLRTASMTSELIIIMNQMMMTIIDQM